MPDEGARLTSEAIVVSKLPDFCKSPTYPVAFQIVGKFDQVIRTASSVRMTETPAFTSFSRVAMVVGDEPGVGGGVKSQVNKGFCRPISWSRTVRIEGQQAIMHDTVMEMNCLGPDGPGNTIGTVVYVKCTAAAVVTPSGAIELTEEPGGGSDGDPDRDHGDGIAGSGGDGGGGDGGDGGDDDDPFDDPDGSSDDSQGDEGASLSAEEQAEFDRQEAELQKEIEQTEREAREAEEELARAEEEVARIDKEMALELAQLAVDAAGVVDPTPASDAISMGMSLGKGDYWGAALSGVSMIPYLGDLAAKPAKAARASKAIARLGKLLKAAKAMASKIAQKLSKLKDKLKKLRDKLAELRKKKRKGGSEGGQGGGKRGEVRVSRNSFKLPPNARRVRGRFPKKAGPNETLYRVDPQTGKITHYQVYDSNGFPQKRVDITGAAHNGIPTPHVVEYKVHGTPPNVSVKPTTKNPRPADPSEIP